MTQRTAVRLARGAFGFVALLFAGATALGVATYADVPSSWGSSGLVSWVFYFAMFSFPVVGVMIASRQVRNPIGWVLLAIGLVWGLIGVFDGYYVYGLVTRPGSLPRPDVVLALDSWIWVPGVGLIGTYLILLFPDGRLPSPRWRPWAWLCAVTLTAASLTIMFAPGSFAESGFPSVANPFGIEALRPLLGPLLFSIVLIPVCILGCATGLIQRYRRSYGQERLQLKWLAAAAGAVAIIISLLWRSVFPPRSEMGRFLTTG